MLLAAESIVAPVRTWLGRMAVAGVLFVAFLGRSGGGLGPSSVCGGLNDLYVLGTVVTALAIPLCFMAFVLSGIQQAPRRPATVEAPPPLYSDAVPERRNRLVSWLLPRAVVIGLALFILAGPSGCTPFAVCGQGNPIARAPGAAIRFVGEAPDHADAAGTDASYTATFDATAPWVVRWTSTADLTRIDVFPMSAMQQGKYFPDHAAFVDDGPSGSTTVNESGTFCVRIALRDKAFEAAERSYFETRRPTGPAPTPRRMSWEIMVTTP